MCDPISAAIVGAGAIAGGVFGGIAAQKHGGNFLTGALLGAGMGAIGTYAGAIGGGFLGGLVGGQIGGAIGIIGGAAAGAAGGSLAANWQVRQLAAPAEAAKRQQAEEEKALKKLAENHQGNLEVNKTASMVNNNRINRTLSSLRISMLPQNNNNEQLVQKVYGVDTNNVVTTTQNMTGLNIAI